MKIVWWFVDRTVKTFNWNYKFLGTSLYTYRITLYHSRKNPASVFTTSLVIISSVHSFVDVTVLSNYCSCRNLYTVQTYQPVNTSHVPTFQWQTHRYQKHVTSDNKCLCCSELYPKVYCQYLKAPSDIRSSGEVLPYNAYFLFSVKCIIITN